MDAENQTRSAAASDDSQPSVESLLRRLRADATDDAPAIGRSDAETAGPEQAVATAVRTLFPDTDFRFDEDVIKQNLEEVLVVLVALRDGETHGKGLMGDVASLFDAQLSPGTVYPRLHELEEAGVLLVHEMVRTKEYRISDDAEARRRVEDAMRQHLALGLVFHEALYGTA